MLKLFPMMKMVQNAPKLVPQVEAVLSNKVKNVVSSLTLDPTRDRK